MTQFTQWLDMITSRLWGDVDPSLLASQLLYDDKSPLIFSSGLFMWLFSAFLVVYTLLRRCNVARTLFVLAFSYYFYYKSSGFYFFLIAVVTCSDWLLARAVSRTENKGRRKALVATSLIIDLGLLAYFKYTNFLGHVFAQLTGAAFHDMNIFLPVGISFFTFQSLSYTIDVYRRKIKPVDSLLNYAFYVSFFPQLVAGPIVRAADFLPQMRRPVFVSREMLGAGFWFIIIGLFKKAVISDYISINFVERVFADPTLYSGIENLLAAYGYGMQIYCDFSGYSDMAIGLAMLMGFHFNINFNNPYKAVSLTDFWRRWHISLSTWLRDYLYISLGGNRKGKLRQHFNLFVTMLLGGLWHGASWNFVLWGAMHGAGLSVHKMWHGLTGKWRISNSWLWNTLGVLLTFHFVILAWIFFRNRDMDNAMLMLRQIGTTTNFAMLPKVVAAYSSVMALIALGYVMHFVPDRVSRGLRQWFIDMPAATYIVALVLIIVIIFQVKTSEIQPFIYFQF